MVLVSTDSQVKGMLGLDVGHVPLFFSFTYEDVDYPCVLNNLYDHVFDSLDEDTGMWIVNPTSESSGTVHINAIL